MTHTVMVVDDSRFVRKALSAMINNEPALEVVATAENGQDCLKKLESFTPDMITLDIDMPIMDGITVLPELVKRQIPVLIVSSLTKKNAEITIKALSLGAADIITKPSQRAADLDEVKYQLLEKLKGLAYIKDKKTHASLIWRAAPQVHKEDRFPIINDRTTLVCIGISTGGPSALARLFPDIDPDLNATFLVVQHMPKHFTMAFAQRLDGITPLQIKEANNNDPLRIGSGLVAKGDHHLTLVSKSKCIMAGLDQGDKMSGHRPSADRLFYSAAQLSNPNPVIAVIMTGMGQDGAEGIQAIKRKGGITIAQDKKSSTIYGMNRTAIDSGCIDQILSLDDIPGFLNKTIARRS